MKNLEEKVKVGIKIENMESKEKLPNRLKRMVGYMFIGYIIILAFNPTMPVWVFTPMLIGIGYIGEFLLKYAERIEERNYK